MRCEVCGVWCVCGVLMAFVASCRDNKMMVISAVFVRVCPCLSSVQLGSLNVN